MVISTLVYLIRHRRLLASSSPHVSDSSSSPSEEADSLEEPLMSSASLERGRELFLGGNYKLIHQLLPALEHGKRAKRLVDAAIDQCAHVQNLREAIYAYKLAGGGGDRGLNYLLRYFFLIVFTEYLIEMVIMALPGEEERRTDQQPKDPLERPSVSFSSWLRERREITNMVARRELLDFS